MWKHTGYKLIIIYLVIYFLFLLKIYMPEKLNRNPCRAAMMEFEINMAEMPLGKLSKSNIQKGKKSRITLEIYSCFIVK